jgi:hypothetical protein
MSSFESSVEKRYCAARAEMNGLQIEQAERLWDIARSKHNSDALENALKTNVFPLFAASEFNNALLSSVRANITAGPVYVHVPRTNKYGSQVWHYALAYEWNGRRVVYTHTDENSDGYYGGYGEWDGFCTEEISDELSSALSNEVSANEFWCTNAFEPTYETTVTVKRALATSHKALTLEELVVGIPEMLWLVVTLMCKRQDFKVGGLLAEDNVALHAALLTP